MTVVSTWTRRATDAWPRTPLYARILAALVIGAGAGILLGPHADRLAQVAKLILRLLGALAPPLVLFAVLHALMTTGIGRGVAGRLARLLIVNTIVAIGFGLLVANVLQPGRRTHAVPIADAPSAHTEPDPLVEFLDSVPESLFKPLVDNNILGIILLGAAFGVALRGERATPLATAEDWVNLAYRTIVRVLGWVIELVPLGVFGLVAGIVGRQGFAPFKSLLSFIVAVLAGLVLQAGWYLVRIRLGCWASPARVLRGCTDALVMAFSTDSSTATMPVTYSCLVNKVGLRESSARLGALIGTNFNNDGTALYEAMSALFVSQLLGQSLTFVQQVTVVLTSIVASVGAAGIPEAGLVTMTLVFTAVKLPTEYIALLLTVDWFLDRSRTVINVMGDINVSCLLDGPTPPAA